MIQFTFELKFISITDPGGLSGVWRYGNLRSQGVLTAPETAASPWVRNWDNVTQTPWLFNPTDKTFISYDDPKSMAIKINYAICQNLGGAMVWSVDEDTSDKELLSVVVQIKTGTLNSYSPKRHVLIYFFYRFPIFHMQSVGTCEKQ